MSHYDDPPWAKGIAIAFFVILLGLMLTDCVGGHHGRSALATVVEKHYEPSHVSTGVGSTSGGKTVVTTNVESEKYILLLNCSGDVFSEDVSAKLWASVNKGDSVTVTPYIGKLTGWNYFNEVSP